LRPEQSGDFYTPSVICFEKGRPAFIGLEAFYEGLVHPDKVAANFKLKLGSNEVLYRGKQDYTARDLAAAVISALKADVERRTNTTVDRAVLSCPANFRDDAKAALLEAAKTAGIEADGLISEPAAAGLAYSYEKRHDRRFVIVDLGGGTLDVSIIEVTGNSVTVEATDGVPKLGGNDFTQRVEKRILEQFEENTHYTPSRDADPLFFQELYQKAEAAKVTLTDRDKATVVIGCRGQQSILEIKRSDFVSLCKDLFDCCLACADKAVQGSGKKWQDIDSLVMVGGASRMPHLQEKLANATGLVPKMDIEPERAVAMGAALKARLVLGEKGVLPRSEIFVREVAAHGLGCAVLKPGGHGEEDLIQAVLITKNTPIPAQRTDHFFLEHEDQTTVVIVVAQGDDGKPIKDCLKIGELTLDNLPEEPKRTKRIKVDYSLDTNGMASVTALDLVGGTTKTVSIDCKQSVKNVT